MLLRAAARSAPPARRAAPSSRRCRVMVRGVPGAVGGAEQSHVSASRGVAIATPSSCPTAIRADSCCAGAIRCSPSAAALDAGAVAAGALLEPEGRGRASAAVRLQLRRHRAVSARRRAGSSVRQPRVSDARACCFPAGSRRASRSRHSARSFASASARRRVHAGGRRLERRRARARRDRRGAIARGSRYNRRITAHTPIEIAGPARDHPLLNPRGDAAPLAFGTFGNCAAGTTPWRTYLTAEENVDDYFGNGAAAQARCGPGELAHRRFGFRQRDSAYRWEYADPRFDSAVNPAESLKFGWIVELDPFDAG